MQPFSGRLTIPAKVVVANCGTAFRHLSRVDGHSTRAVFGLEKLKHRAVFYEAFATFINDDTGFNVTDHARGPMRLRKNYQREVTMRTGFGTVTAHVHILVRHWRGGTCQSEPGRTSRLTPLPFVGR